MKKVDICTNCASRRYCSSLCGEAKVYADQDKVNLKEKTIDPLRALYSTHTWPEVAPQLTKREKQILRLLVVGVLKSEISETLHISIKNVYSHLSNLRRKLLNL